MAWDCWASIEAKLESAEGYLRQASKDISPELPPQFVALHFTGVDVRDPRWRTKLTSHISAFLVECRSVTDIIRSCFGEDSGKWMNTLSPDEQRRRRKFQKSFRYKSFVRLPLSLARVDTVHRQGFAEIWVKLGNRYIPLQELDDAEMKHILAGSDSALQWAATLPPQRTSYLPDDFFFKTVGGRYKPLFPECQSYLRRTREVAGKALMLYETVHGSNNLTKPPRKT
jgi:hypothetical protein